MKTTSSFVILFLLMTLYHSQAMRCRSGNQKLSDSIRKVMQKCKRKSNSNRSDEDSSSDSSDGDSSSDSDIFDENFFSTKRDDSNSKTRMTRSRHQEYRQDELKPYYMKNHTQKQDRMSNDDNYYGNNNNNNNSHNKNRDKDSRDGGSERNKNQDEQSCVTQCFFDELKLTNRQGFPDRTSVINLMLQGIHDPMVRDFVEQSVIECFHFVYGLHLDKCTFSHNLLSCFADKARERCEDWDD